jgi:uncharacterized protein YhfF
VIAVALYPFIWVAVVALAVAFAVGEGAQSLKDWRIERRDKRHRD